MIIEKVCQYKRAFIFKLGVIKYCIIIKLSLMKYRDKNGLDKGFDIDMSASTSICFFFDLFLRRIAFNAFAIYRNLFCIQIF